MKRSRITVSPTGNCSKIYIVYTSENIVVHIRINLFNVLNQRLYFLSLRKAFVMGAVLGELAGALQKFKPVIV